jgi:hypothetical protein
MRSLDWFMERKGSTVLRKPPQEKGEPNVNSRAFSIDNEKVARYAWELQANGFEYGEL